MMTMTVMLLLLIIIIIIIIIIEALEYFHAASAVEWPVTKSL